MPRAKYPRDVMKERYGNKSVRVELRLTQFESDKMLAGIKAGGYVSASYFVRRAIFRFAEAAVPMLKNVPETRGDGKGVHLQVRVTQMEADTLDEAMRAGGYRSRSEFLRYAIRYAAEYAIANPKVAREVQEEIDHRSVWAKNTVEVPVDLEPPPMPDVPVDVPEVMTPEAPPPPLAAILGIPLFAPKDGPTAAPLDLDEDGWVG